ncbi:TPA: succinate dehydrogenase flavoprotein subunit, partial [Candidatus Azambacteria bacterium]|nr:succinate dehydrogenase flavoprotein subunit [Candidatus Azambacteria bacterium]
ASQSDLDAALTRTQRWENSKVGQGEDPVQIKKDLQKCMQLNFSVFREGEAMAEGLAELKEIRERLQFARLDDKSSDFNT